MRPDRSNAIKSHTASIFCRLTENSQKQTEHARKPTGWTQNRSNNHSLVSGVSFLVLIREIPGTRPQNDVLREARRERLEVFWTYVIPGPYPWHYAHIACIAIFAKQYTITSFLNLWKFHLTGIPPNILRHLVGRTNLTNKKTGPTYGVIPYIRRDSHVHIYLFPHPGNLRQSSKLTRLSTCHPWRNNSNQGVLGRNSSRRTTSPHSDQTRRSFEKWQPAKMLCKSSQNTGCQ